MFQQFKDENDEPFYTYTDPFTRHFVRQSIKKGRYSTLNQYYKAAFSGEVFDNISKELNVNGNKCKILNK